MFIFILVIDKCIIYRLWVAVWITILIPIPLDILLTYKDSDLNDKLTNLW